MKIYNHCPACGVSTTPTDEAIKLGEEDYITVHTTSELKQAKIEAYQYVLDACNKTESLDCIKDFIEEKIYSVEKKMEG